MLNRPLLPPPAPEPVLPALRGGRRYLDFSELPDCVSVRVSVSIYTDDLGGDSEEVSAENAAARPGRKVGA